ncbi:hypothetical protein BDZ45DRAFT_301136 [Acephala macrosclerotiorum]|nr:hypothetical protein BDZ45DRAFT_301136 [Acephala macrosclerotiorum]
MPTNKMNPPRKTPFNALHRPPVPRQLSNMNNPLNPRAPSFQPQPPPTTGTTLNIIAETAAMAIAEERSRLAPGLTSSINGPFPATFELGTAEDAMATQWTRPKPAGGVPHLACLPREVHNTIAALSDDMSLAIVSVRSRPPDPFLARLRSVRIQPLDADENIPALRGHWNSSLLAQILTCSLKVTCRALRIRLPHKVRVRAADEYYHPITLLSDEFYKPITQPIGDTAGDHLRHISSPLEDVIIVPSLASVRRIKMYELLKDYMKPDSAALLNNMTTELGSMALGTRGLSNIGDVGFRPKYRLYAGHYGVCAFITEERYRELREKYWEEFPALPQNYQELVRKAEEEALKAAEERKIVPVAMRDSGTGFKAYLALRMLSRMGR